MHSRPPALLRQLIRMYGPALSNDPRRVEGFLHDLCGQHTREIFVLVHAQEAKIPAELLAAGGLAGDPALWQRLSRRLQDRMAFSPEAADWAVQSWALALNIQPSNHRAWYTFPWLLDQVAHWQRGRIRGRNLPYSGVQWKLPRRLDRRWNLSIGAALIVGMVLLLLWLNLPAGFRSALAFWEQPAVTSSPPPLATMSVEQVESFYPLPREVRIAAEEVSVYAEPQADSSVLARLSPLGASVTIDNYARGGRWAHISEPVSGWIDSRQITHTVLVMEGTASYPIVLGPGVGRITANGVRVRQEPTLSALSLGQFNQDETVVVLAVTFDGRWYHVAAPMAGWVSSDYVEMISNEGNS